MFLTMRETAFILLVEDGEDDVTLVLRSFDKVGIKNSLHEALFEPNKSRWMSANRRRKNPIQGGVMREE
jgi:hypothetical protein